MKQPLRSVRLGACVLSFMLGASALAAEEEIATGSWPPTAQPIGWSADEQRYAIRVYSHTETGDLESMSEAEVKAYEELEASNAPLQDKEGFCKGYVDHRGKRFRGALTLMVLERDKRVLSIPIQEEPRCTPPETAAARLAEAKKKLAEMGIDLSRPGKEQPLVSGKRIEVKPEQQPPYALEFVKKIKVKDLDEGGMSASVRGTLEVYRHQGGKKQNIYTRKVDKELFRPMGGIQEDTLANVHLSPSGARAVVFGFTHSGDGRSGFNSALRVATVLGWPEGAVVQEAK